MSQKEEELVCRIVGDSYLFGHTIKSLECLSQNDTQMFVIVLSL